MGEILTRGYQVGGDSDEVKTQLDKAATLEDPVTHEPAYTKKEIDTYFKPWWGGTAAMMHNGLRRLRRGALLAAALLCTATSLWALDIPLRHARTITMPGAQQYFRLGTHLYAQLHYYPENSTAIGDLNLDTGAFTSHLRGKDPILFGTYSGGLLLEMRLTRSPEKWARVRYNPQTGRITVLSGIHRDILADPGVFDYQNGQVIEAMPVYGSPQSKFVFLNLDTKETKTVVPKALQQKYGFSDGMGWDVWDVSPDRTHALYNGNSGPYVVNLQTGVSAEIGGGLRWADFSMIHPHFLTNNLFLILHNPDTEMQRSSSSYRAELYNLSGKLVATVSLTTEFGPVEYFDAISPDLRHASVGTSDAGYYVDSTALREYIDKLGYLIHPTTGVLNDSQVRVRQLPNLEAPVLGALNKGEKVDVLDRSGSTVKIDTMDDYWYKVRTPGGLEGWAYGAFIDLAKSAP